MSNDRGFLGEAVRNRGLLGVAAIAAIVTEDGVHRAPYEESLA